VNIICSGCQATLEQPPPQEISLSAGATEYLWVKPSDPHPADLEISVEPVDRRFKEAVVFKVDLGMVMLFGTNPDLFGLDSMVTITLSSKSA
jgi:hypothetical protein